MKTFFVRVLTCLSVALLLPACTPMSVLQTPQGSELSMAYITPEQLAQLPKVPTRIRAGDTLRIIRDAQDSATLDLRNLVDDSQSQTYVVRADGTFSFRYAGTVDAAGKTPDELAALLRSKLDAYYREPGVTVNIQSSPTSKVVIGGAVRNALMGLAVGEIDIAGTRLQMKLVAIAKAIGKAHLLNPAHINSVDEPRDSFRNEMRMIDGKRQFECR